MEGAPRTGAAANREKASGARSAAAGAGGEVRCRRRRRGAPRHPRSAPRSFSGAELHHEFVGGHRARAELMSEVYSPQRTQRTLRIISNRSELKNRSDVKSFVSIVSIVVNGR